MLTLGSALYNLDQLILKKSQRIANSLRLGLTRNEIDEKVQGFSWILPEELYEFYQWHNGLSSEINSKKTLEDSLKQKDRWQGDLSTPNNQIYLRYDNRNIAIKFPPLEYALAGHQHLKKGQCSLNLLPIFTLNQDKNQNYCLVNLEPEQFGLYFLNGKGIHPSKIDEQFLSAQIRFNSLVNLVSFITNCCNITVKIERENLNTQEIGCEVFEIYKSVLGCGIRFGCTSLGDGNITWYATYLAPPKKGKLDIDSPQTLLLQRYKNWYFPVIEIIASTPNSSIINTDIYDANPLTSWSSKHVTLLGDAAHRMTPDMNQGAGQTIEDAIILASLLERNFSLQEALSRYEHLRIPRTSKIVKQSRQSGEIEHIRNPLLCSLRNTMYALTPSELLIKQMVIVSRFELT